MSNKLVHVIYTGRVQGVGFRYTVQNFAVQLGLAGWVKNLLNGGVELVAEGAEEKLERLIKMLQAEMGRYITDTRIERDEASGKFKSFDIRF